MKNTLIETLKAIITPYLKGVSELSLNDHIVDNLGIDSLDLVDILVEIETQFAVSLEEEEINQLAYVKDIIALLEQKTKADEVCENS